MIKSLDYNPDEIDVRAVVSVFIENVDPERFESVLFYRFTFTFLKSDLEHPSQARKGVMG